MITLTLYVFINIFVSLGEIPFEPTFFVHVVWLGRNISDIHLVKLNCMRGDDSQSLQKIRKHKMKSVRDVYLASEK